MKELIAGEKWMVDADPRRFAAWGENLQVLNEQGHTVCFMANTRSGEENYRRAHLIAAAPALYEALSACPLPSSNGNATEFYGRFYDWYKGVASPALALARGEAPDSPSESGV